ncbi:MAG: amidohydrolase [Flavobacteriales bacterium]|jgi:aminocarboxymuconate-semialdehyde decarboxylase|nr:amidohydrolase [Flavobacteriales bacterium]|tara:strand:- start:1199 stop:2233 length:1035 start_codon:yes stop_codon:yes gene_type:complete
MRINGHGHVLPEPQQIPIFMKKKKLFWIDEDKGFMRQGNWSRPISGPGFFVQEKIKWMHQNNIDHGVMLCLSQLYCNGWKKKDCFDGIRFQNDFNASVQHAHPKKFTCGFVVQPLYIDQAIKEIDRCVNELGLKILCLPTHFLMANGEWRSTAEADVDPIFELANNYGLAIQIHPYDGEKMIALKNQYWRFHLVWMMAQCADTLHVYTLRDLPHKYPKLRTSFAHGGMLGMANYGRRVHGFDGRPDLFKNLQDPRKTLGHKNIYFDTLVHDPHTLNLLKKRVGVKQIIMGLDDPYPLGEIEGVGNSYPGRILDQANSEGLITKQEKKDIWCKNVLDWLGMKKML